MTDHIIGESYEKKAFVGRHDSPKATRTMPDYVSKAELDTKGTAGAVGQPYHASGTLKTTGSYKTNAPYLNTTASEEHRESACYPAIHQDTNPLAKNQYE